MLTNFKNVLADTIRLLRIPMPTGMLASASTFLKLVSIDLPGSSEKPFWISKWVRVELTIRI